METYLIEINGQVNIKEEALTKLQELKKQKDSIERELKTLSNAITEELKGRYTETTKVSNYNFVVKGGFYDVEFDMETFMKENFFLYVKYLKPHFTEIKYSLVSATREKKNV